MIVHLLLATVPDRRVHAGRLLDSLVFQTVCPDVVHLVLDGYGDVPPIKSLFLSVRGYPTGERSGPGGRWRVLRFLPEEGILVVLDDDQILDGHDVIEKLVKTAEKGAAAYRGADLAGVGGVFPEGTILACGGAAVMAVRVVDLVGLDETYQEIRSKIHFDPFGDGGDDEAVIACHLWKKGVMIRATGPLGIREAPGTQEGSQFERRMAARGARSPFWQREAIAKVTGWPWVSHS